MPRDPNMVTADNAGGAPQTAAQLAATLLGDEPAAAEAPAADPAAAAAPAPAPAAAPAKAPAKKPAAGQVTKKGAAPPVDEHSDMVKVRITKGGHGEVHDGAEGRYDWNDEVVLPLPVAKDLEGRLFAEIVGNA